MADLEIRNLVVSIEGKEILKGVNLDMNKGEIVALMGPNGSGKSTLAYTLMGRPGYDIVKGTIKLYGKDVTQMGPDERSRLGLFLSFQYPSEISGVTVSNFLRTALNSHRENPVSVVEFWRVLNEKMELLHIDPALAKRYLNEGFSGGEKKQMEILQMAMLQPEIAILDETDSGLDIDALRTISQGVSGLKQYSGMGVLVITHYQRILNYLKPDKVHVFVDGKIVKSGGPELAHELEKKGYAIV